MKKPLCSFACKGGNFSGLATLRAKITRSPGESTQGEHSSDNERNSLLSWVAKKKSFLKELLNEHFFNYCTLVKAKD